jgi:2-succinyl-6-hydroxy-2,4-cyclohexadiene-1-carboxylate synthase
MSLNVLTAGAGTPLLLLHGFTGTALTWSRQIESWKGSHRVIAPDLLGHGGSEAPADPARYALGRQADDLADLLVLLGATPAAVLGYSMGARLALVLALSHPVLVERLILESPSAGLAEAAARTERKAADERLADDIETEGTEAFVDYWETLPVLATQAALPEAERARLRRERLRHDPSGLAASLRGAGQGAMEPLHQRLVGVQAPTLVLAGALDLVGLERARLVADGIPGGRLQVIPGAGHTPHLEAPEAFECIVLDHLSLSAIN